MTGHNVYVSDWWVILSTTTRPSKLIAYHTQIWSKRPLTVRREKSGGVVPQGNCSYPIYGYQGFFVFYYTLHFVLPPLFLMFYYYVL
jgi:hypothetical protein